MIHPVAAQAANPGGALTETSGALRFLAAPEAWVFVLVILPLVAIGVWWVYYLTQEGQVYTEYRLQKLTNDRLHASFLIQADQQIASDPERYLGSAFPHLLYRRGRGGWHQGGRERRVRESFDDVECRGVGGSLVRGQRKPGPVRSRWRAPPRHHARDHPRQRLG